MSPRVLVTLLSYSAVIVGVSQVSASAAWIVGGAIPLVAVLIFKLKDDLSGPTRQNIDAKRGG
ncbi:MAG: hypothetical protein IT419_04775 [Planctomycetes bacterium]|jgi:hypothetical protein|nr:hypothetical protein [Planctomycetota bacterium]OQZ06333.1 MAG: hypothetical protein B6D36_05505 [Planctomycetes bacterium UTPLA1]